MEFPQYRKLTGFKRYYKITGEKDFYETYLLNGEKVMHHIVANQFPEMLRIRDMLTFGFGYAEMSEAEIEENF